jgi:hypothetical protein
MATRESAIGDPVELTEAVGRAPAGARGAITDILEDDKVIVELTSMAAEPILDRIVVVWLAKLRPVEPTHHG